MVDNSVYPKGVEDVYIDDTVGLTLDLDKTDHTLRLERIVLLVIHFKAHPRDPNQPILRRNMTALAKLVAKSCTRRSQDCTQLDL